MEKRKLFIDFDSTLVNTAKAVCTIYNYDFRPLSSEMADWTKYQLWDFSDVCPLADASWLYNIFERTDLFDCLELFDDAIDVLWELSRYYDIYIVTIGSLKNLGLKTKYIAKWLPMINNVILLNDTVNGDKRLIDMTSGTFIDDLPKNLDNSNALLKLVYGKKLEYNEDCKYKRIYNWNTIRGLLIG